MKYLLWKLFGRRWWMKLTTIYRSGNGIRMLATWEQRRDEIRKSSHNCF